MSLIDKICQPPFPLSVYHLAPSNFTRASQDLAMASDPRPVTQIEYWPQAKDSHGQSDPRGVDRSTDEPDSHQPAEASPAREPRKRKRVEEPVPRPPSMFPDLPLQVHPTAIGSSSMPIPQHHASPWTRYEERYQIDLNGMVTVVEGKGALAQLVTVRQIPKTDLDRKVRLLNQLRGHRSFVACIELFLSDSIMQIVSEFMDFTLLHVLATAVFPTEKQVAAIAGQGSVSLFDSASLLIVADLRWTSIPASTSPGSRTSYAVDSSG